MTEHTPPITGGTYIVNIEKPLNITWQPKEDITTYELAMCIPILMLGINRLVYPHDIDTTLPYMRHFQIK